MYIIDPTRKQIGAGGGAGVPFHKYYFLYISKEQCFLFSHKKYLVSACILFNMHVHPMYTFTQFDTNFQKET